MNNPTISGARQWHSLTQLDPDREVPGLPVMQGTHMCMQGTRVHVPMTRACGGWYRSQRDDLAGGAHLSVCMCVCVSFSLPLSEVISKLKKKL